MILKKLTPDHPDIPALKKLYEEAFPENERPMSMDDILKLVDMIPCDLLGVYPDETPDTFVGFFFGIRGESGVYGVYYATDPNLRSTGIGSKAFKAILEYYGELPFWFSYESTFEESENAEQRERRRKFYLKNGFFETGWFASMNGTEFIIACSKEEFDKEAFEKFFAEMASGTGAPVPELYRRD
ncbi:MAG: GNAT family N-acetyltransferase [Parasporobacterium sp.]|nr:GNAT family N-acetyltransferase [Parasporobacterium sp.]